MIQKVFYDDNQFITLEIPENGAIGLLISGGTDSSLLCYLLADTILKNKLNTKIYPITAEMLRRPYCVTYATNVLQFVSKNTGFQFENHLCFTVPNHNLSLTDDERNEIYSRNSDDYQKRYGMSFVFHGNTANPPQSALPDTRSSRRPASRDNLEWRKTQETNPNLRVPFIHIDKKVIAALYKKYGLLDTLYPITRSCEGELGETAYFTKDCFAARPQGEECWWCRERQYGFGMDVAPAPTSLTPTMSAVQPKHNKPDIHILSERFYYSADEFVTFNIPIAGAVGCFVSGGLDSALVCYLLAQTIVKYKLKTKLYPITGEILARPYSLRHASDVVSFISSKTGYRFGHHLSYFVPNHHDELNGNHFDEVEAFAVNELVYKYELNTLFSGDIANPSIDLFPINEFPDRPLNRDDIAWQKSLSENPDLEVPFLHHNKKVIGKLYKKLGLMTSLFPLTRSCESSIVESEFFTKTCLETRTRGRVKEQPCWNCYEREWGFTDNESEEAPDDRKDLLLGR